MADLRDKLKEIATRADAATPGPYISGVAGNLRVYGPDNSEYSGIFLEAFRGQQGRDNIEWICAARTEHPALVKFARAIDWAERSGDYGTLDVAVKDALAQLRADLGAE